VVERIHFKILREIERQGSLTAAARVLHLTQSALSHAMKKFEAQVATRLWVKEGRTLQLTQAGHYLLKEAKRLLPQLERVDEVLNQYAMGERGALRIGMECHPCYQWLLTVVSDFLEQWPEVDIDVKQRFQFGGMAALFHHEIDLLVTPDPLYRKGITFTPVFDYEQVLVIEKNHKFSQRDHILAQDLMSQTLYTYPVEIGRLDIYTLFLLPANCMPKKHKIIETTEIMLQLIAANRGVAALPSWLVTQYEKKLPITTVRLGKKGIRKHIYLGTRTSDDPHSFAMSLITLAKRLYL